MITPERLLQMDPVDALRAQIDEVLIAPLKSSYLKIGRPVKNAGLSTSVELILDISKAPVDLWDRRDAMTFSYNRIRPSDFFFGANTEIGVSFPIKANDAIAGLMGRYGIPMRPEEFDAVDLVEPGNHHMLARDQSYRWVDGLFFSVVEQNLNIAGRLAVTRYTPPFGPAWKSSDVIRQLVFHMNATNVNLLPVELSSEMFTYTPPEVNGAFDKADNTRLRLIFSGIPYLGEATIFYSRRSFPATYRFPVELSGGAVTNVTGLMTKLSTALGCTITTSDVNAQVISGMAIGEKRKLLIHFNPTSLAYVGEVWVNYTRTS